MCKRHPKTCMCVHVALVLIDNVRYTESTAGHMCVQSEIVFFCKVTCRGKTYMCMMQLCYLANVDAQRKPLGTHMSAHCKFAILLSQRHMMFQRACMCAHVALRKNCQVKWHRGHHSASMGLHIALVFLCQIKCTRKTCT